MRPGTTMKNIVTFDDGCVGVGQYRESEMHFLRMSAIDLYRVNADRREMNPTRFKIRQLTLKTPQLGVAQRSPMAAVENDERASWRDQIGKRDLFSVLV